MTEPSNRHMVFTVHDGHVSFQANWSRPNRPNRNLSGSEPLTWYGVHTGERISEISADDMIDHLIDDKWMGWQGMGMGHHDKLHGFPVANLA